MHQRALAKRRALALMRLADLTGIDLSRSALPKSPTLEVYQLHQLEKLVEELPTVLEAQQGLEELRQQVRKETLKTLWGTEGIGPATMQKIEKALE